MATIITRPSWSTPTATASKHIARRPSSRHDIGPRAPVRLRAESAANTTGLAANASDRIIYETDSGKLFNDADGAGIHFTALIGGLALTYQDFQVVEAI